MCLILCHCALKQNVSIIPFTLKYEDTVGLFGAENYFVKVTLKVLDSAPGTCFEEPYWICGYIDYLAGETDAYFDGGYVDQSNYGVDNTYEQANVRDSYLPYGPGDNAYVSIDLNNLKVNNQFIDNWLDTRLYTKDREEHPYDKMYVSLKDYFYIGVHARNTRRLPYNIECVVGKEFIRYEAIEDKKLIMKTIAYGSR